MSTISAENIEKVRLANDIIDVVSGYLSLSKKGKNYFGLCPFHHEKSPSFSVNPAQQIYKCFGCGAGGNVFSFIMQIETMTFPESVKFLAKNAGIIIPEEDENYEQYREKEAIFYAANMAAEYYLDTLLNTPEAEKAREYLATRGLIKDDYKTFGIGFAPDGWDHLIKLAEKKSFKIEYLLKAGLIIERNEGGFYDRFRGRITFAIHNISGQVVGFGARRIINDNSPKYINSPETDIYQKRFILYGLYQSRESIREENNVIFVEGYTDYTSMKKNGINNVVATSGTALTEDHAKLVRRYAANAILLYDNDSAGAAAAIRGAEILLENGLEVKICILPQGKDPDEFARSNDETAIRAMLASATPFIDFKLGKLENLKQTGTVTQKTDATKELLASIARVTDPLKKTFMIKELAEKLKIQESLLWEEIQKNVRQALKNKPEKEEKKQPQNNNRFFLTKKGSAELGLLTAIFINPDLIPKVLLNIEPEYFNHPEIQEFFIHLAHEGIDAKSFNTPRYLGSIQDAYISQALSNVLSDEKIHYLYKTWEFAMGCIISIQTSLCDLEIDKIRQELQQSPGNPKLLLEYKILKKEEKDISMGKYIQK